MNISQIIERVMLGLAIAHIFIATIYTFGDLVTGNFEVEVTRYQAAAAYSAVLFMFLKYCRSFPPHP